MRDKMCHQQCHVASGNHLLVAFLNSLSSVDTSQGWCRLAPGGAGCFLILTFPSLGKGAEDLVGAIAGVDEIDPAPGPGCCL